MRRAMVVVPCALVAVGLAGLVWTSRASQNPELALALPPPAENPLPIRQVVLFNSGVGYFQREGEVDGDARIDLSFPVSDINDLLKSLVLQDVGGGRVRAISYDSQDPIDKILRSFAIDLDSNPTFGQILNQARGEKIEIQLSAKDKAIPGRLVGKIVGMETRAGRDEKQPIDILNLMTADGLQSIALDQFLGVRFLNPALEADFQRALKVLAGSHDSSKKTVTLGFDGAGKRGVRVGYVVERPIWKTSYRLRIEPKGKASLQGWALVDNTSDDDWNDVRMVLVSGRPISFQMNLYDPLYIPRPMVEPEQFASLRPPVYSGAMNVANINNFNPFAGGGALGGGALGGGALGGRGAAPGERRRPRSLRAARLQADSRSCPAPHWAAPPEPRPAAGISGCSSRLRVGRTRDSQPILNPYQTSNRNPAILSKLTYEELQARRQELAAAREEAREQGASVAMNFREGIQSVATDKDVGDYHQYVIDQKITLSRQKSAMLPIVDKSIEAAKVSIYNESVHAKYPLLGLRLKNTSGQPLTQGPITVYDAGTYAGDTRVLDLQPDEERLLSYALDQAVEVKTTTETIPSPTLTLKLDEAKLSADYKERETRTYVIKNRATVERSVIVEHPIRDGWTLVDGALPKEKSRDMYRFEIKVAAGATAKLVVSEEQPRNDDLAFPVIAAAIGVEIKAVLHADQDKLVRLKANLGLVVPTLKSRETKSFFVQNLTDIDRDFTIDHVVRKDWTLLPGDGAKPVVGPHVHRFVLHVGKRKTAERDLVEERTFDGPAMLVKNVGEGTLRGYLAHPAVSAPMKAGLTKTIELRRKLEEGEKQVGNLSGQLKAASADQARLRDNLHVIPQTAEPYKDFLKKFVTQEAEIDALQRQVRVAETGLATALQEYQAFLTAWTAE